MIGQLAVVNHQLHMIYSAQIGQGVYNGINGQSFQSCLKLRNIRSGSIFPPRDSGQINRFLKVIRQIDKYSVRLSGHINDFRLRRHDQKPFEFFGSLE